MEAGIKTQSSDAILRNNEMQGQKLFLENQKQPKEQKLFFQPQIIYQRFREVNDQENENKKSKSLQIRQNGIPTFKKVLYTSCIIQILIDLTLLVLLLLSDGISLPSFVICLVVSIFQLACFLVLQKKIQSAINEKQINYNKHRVSKTKEKKISKIIETKPIIKLDQGSRNNQKTLKIKQNSQLLEQAFANKLTAKKLDDYEPSKKYQQYIKTQEQLKEVIKTYLLINIILLSIMVLEGLCLLTILGIQIKMDFKDQIIEAAVLICVNYVIISFIVYALLTMIRNYRIFKNETIPLQKQEGQEQNEKPPIEVQIYHQESKISLDNEINRKKSIQLNKSKICKPQNQQQDVQSVKNILKESTLEKRQIQNNPSKTHQQKPHQAQHKAQLKKSVLKQAKVKSIKQDRQPMQQNQLKAVERRKVEINSKKVDVFEYDQISPVNSLIDNQQKEKKKTISLKVQHQKHKQIISKIEQEEKILYKHKQSNRTFTQKRINEVTKESFSRSQHEKISSFSPKIVTNQHINYYISS